MKKKLYFAFYIGLSLIPTILFGQVTIGSEKVPSNGTLLDLKEYNSTVAGGATSTKGLGLPRVKLLYIESLIPAVEDATPLDKEAHIGLIVYHVTNEKNPACASIKQGAYVWTGLKWQTLDSDKEMSANVSKLVDDRGNGDVETYLVRSFGNAGTWMLENLRAKKFAERTNPTDVAVSIPLESSYTNSKTEARWAYPNIKGETDASKDDYYLQNPKLGLMYNFVAATNKNKETNDMGNVDHAKIQGICPKDWHLPSDYEWTKLEEEMTLHTDLYTNRTTAIDPTGSTLPFTTDMNATPNGLRGEHAFAFKSQCAPPYPKEDPTSLSQYGNSLAPKQGGFAVEFAGAIFDGQARYSDSQTYLWTSSTAGSPEGNVNNAYRRGIFSIYSGVSRKTLAKDWYFSVRCVKD